MKKIVVQQLLIISLMTAVAAIAGPFGTYLEMSVWERIAYWFIAISVVALMMQLGMRLFLSHPALAGVPYVILLVGAAAIAALPSSVILVFIETYFRSVEPTLAFFAMVWAMVTVVGSVVSYAHFPPRWRRAALLHRWPAPTAAAHSFASGEHGAVGNRAAPSLSPFFRRLRPEIGRDLISISVADHYIEVDTRAGRDTLLLRLSDAEAELADYPGLRVHRSHWVAREEIAGFVRHGHTGTLTMSNGREIPVARARVKDVQDILGQ